MTSVWLSSSLSAYAANCKSGKIVKWVASDCSVLHSPTPPPWCTSLFCIACTKFYKKTRMKVCKNSEKRDTRLMTSPCAVRTWYKYLYLFWRISALVWPRIIGSLCFLRAIVTVKRKINQHCIQTSFILSTVPRPHSDALLHFVKMVSKLPVLGSI